MKLKKYSTRFGLFLCCMIQLQCDIINPAEEIPAVVELNAPVFQVNAGQGTAQHKITEFWTYADNSFIGAFAPPVSINHITDKTSALFSFRPGIRNNGILDDAIIYPMFTIHEETLTTTPGTVSNVTPIIRYRPDVSFSLIADFETQNNFVENRDTVSGTALVRSSVEPFEGAFSGEIILTPFASFIEVTHPVAMSDLPVDGTPAYLELHYKTEIPLEIGLLGLTLDNQSFPKYFYLLKPNDEWNKIYLEITPYLQESELPGYKILFRANYPAGAMLPSYKIQLDNIQVVHL